jgi:hypothetical protein
VTLGVELINDRDIVVSHPETGFSVTYRKNGDAINGMGRFAEPGEVMSGPKPGRPRTKRLARQVG